MKRVLRGNLRACTARVAGRRWERRMTTMKRLALLLTLMLPMAALACKTFSLRPSSSSSPGGLPPSNVTAEERTIDVPLEDGTTAHLGATLIRAVSLFASGPTVVLVPGAGDVSRNGTRPGDGVVKYDAPVDVTLRWAEALARDGKRVLIFDKRTCGPKDNHLCTKNVTTDVDTNGPVALARDVDAACAAARREPGFDGRLVLWAHGQAVDVALSSSCAKEATALVLAAPIPRGIDLVLTAALKERASARQAAAKAEKDPARKAQLESEALALKNQAATREAGFTSMKAGKFAPTARVDGATLGYWTGWMKLTAATSDLLAQTPRPKLIVVGADDVQYGKKDHALIAELATSTGARLLEVPNADHHLLEAGALSDAVATSVCDALDALLQSAPAI